MLLFAIPVVVILHVSATENARSKLPLPLCPRGSLVEGHHVECKRHFDCPVTHFCYRDNQKTQGHCCRGTLLAISDIRGDRVFGFVQLVQFPGKGGVRISGSIKGLNPGLHGFHVHAYGNLVDGCTSAGPHFNPFNSNHGAPSDKIRHVGDLGNLRVNEKGIAKIDFNDRQISLVGPRAVAGRAFVVHELEDDLGRGKNEESLRTGNSGSRVACGMIVFDAFKK